MDFQSSNPFNPINEGKIDIINGQYLKYAILEDGNSYINQSNFYDYIGISKKDKDYKYYPDSTDVNIFYNSKLNNQIEIGIPFIQIPAICISIIQMDAETKKFKEAARNSAILLMYFATKGLGELLVEGRFPDYEEVLQRLMKVPPIKKQKKK